MTIRPEDLLQMDKQIEELLAMFADDEGDADLKYYTNQDPGLSKYIDPADKVHHDEFMRELKIASCNHTWVESYGLSRSYWDCSKCSAKKEEHEDIA
jgi:hypothetical protein